MAQLTVFFDYTCPFCLHAHAYLKELAPRYPQVKILWKPCEAHPRPESFGPHSDLCVQGYFFALEHGADLWEYHERMYRAAQKDRVDIENPDELAACVKGLLDPEAFRRALREGTYRKRQLTDNDEAYEKSGVWAVPAYRMSGKKLDSVEGVGVTREQLERFLSSCAE